MPSAVWQGFCNLLRGPPPPGSRLAACIASSSRGSVGAQTRPWRSPRRPRCPRWFPRRTCEATKAAKMAEDASKTAQDNPKVAQDYLRTAQEASKTTEQGYKGASSEARKVPKHKSSSGPFKIFAFSPFRASVGARRPKRPPRWPRDGSRGPPDNPRGLQDDLKTAQESPWRAQDRRKRASSWPERVSGGDQNGLKGRLDVPRQPQHGS